MHCSFNKLRAVATAAAIVAAFADLAAAQSIPPTVVQPTTIRFYNYNLASAGWGRDSTLEMLATFAAANPNIKVEGVPVSPPDMTSRIQADLVAGLGPDVAQIIFSDLAYVADNFGPVTFESIVPASEFQEHLADMFPAGVELGRLNGKTYGLTYVFSMPMLYYNADLFRKAGLDPDAPLSTWDDVKAAAIAIKEKTGKTGLIAGFTTSGGDWSFQGFLLSNGGQVLSEDRKTLMFAEPKSIEAIELLRQIASKNALEIVSGVTGAEIQGSGNAGMFLTTSAVQGSLLRASTGKFELRAAPMPAFGNKPARPTNSGSALVILSQDPVKQRAAWELVKHLTSDYANTINTTKNGYLPMRKNAIESEKYLAPWLRENPLTMINIEQLPRMNQWVSYPGPNYKQIATILLNALEQAVFGKGAPAKVMADAQRQAQALMPN